MERTSIAQACEKFYKVTKEIIKILDALKRRINYTVDELKKQAEELLKLGCFKAASFIRDYSNTIVTFAILAVKGRKVPWNSNLIERLMGERYRKGRNISG